jgi:hypothetical protein
MQQVKSVSFWATVATIVAVLFGKIRYRTFRLGNMPTDHEGGFEHGIPGIDQVLEVSGSMLNELNGACYPLPFATPVPGESVSLLADRKSIFVNVGECNRSKFVATVTLKYLVK